MVVNNFKPNIQESFSKITDFQASLDTQGDTEKPCLKIGNLGAGSSCVLPDHADSWQNVGFWIRRTVACMKQGLTSHASGGVEGSTEGRWSCGAQAMKFKRGRISV